MPSCPRTSDTGKIVITNDTTHMEMFSDQFIEVRVHCYVVSLVTAFTMKSSIFDTALSVIYHNKLLKIIITIYKSLPIG